MSLEKIAVVTGASKGIGRAIALALAKQGNYVVINYSGSKEAAENVLSEVKKEGGQGEVYQCDVADFENTKEMMEDLIKRHKKIDILVNNAGITKDGLAMGMSEEDFNKVLDVNLKGAFHTVRHVIRTMIKQRGGRIINISSVSGIMGNAGQLNYSAAKAGLIGMTKTLARELAGRNITVNAVAPGFIETQMTEKLSQNIKDAVTGQIPLGRFGKPEDIAEMVSFLASEKAAYITGQVFCVDGGLNI
ncbi:MAG TPA: 3-oxoacyl-[acyl-carrier-protein] reductase [Lachnospiraceae bacterium]